jgi:hypothetical protein
MIMLVVRVLCMRLFGLCEGGWERVEDERSGTQYSYESHCNA